MRPGFPQSVEVRRLGEPHGIVCRFLAPAPAIQHDQHHGAALLHGRTAPCRKSKVRRCAGSKRQRQRACPEPTPSAGAEPAALLRIPWVAQQLLKAKRWGTKCGLGRQTNLTLTLTTLTCCNQTVVQRIISCAAKGDAAAEARYATGRRGAPPRQNQPGGVQG